MSEEFIESTVNAEPVVNVEPQQTEQVEQINEPVNNEPVNAGSGEVATPQQETVKPVQSAEDNAKYAEIRRKAEADAESRTRDKMISEMYGESHGIHTYSDYQRAVAQAEQEAREQQIRQEYEAKGVPEELLEELVLSKREREERKIEKQNEMQQQQARMQQEKNFSEFLAEYPTVKADEIPNEVWVEVGNGKSLVDAYAKHEVTILKAKIAEYESKFKAQETNQTNANSSTGSLTGNGIADTGFISHESFEANKGDQRWVMKNLNKIQESRLKW